MSQVWKKFNTVKDIVT